MALSSSPFFSVLCLVFLLSFSFRSGLCSLCNYDSDFTTEESCGTVTPCSDHFRSCRCNAPCNDDSYPSTFTFALNSWSGGVPTFSFRGASGSAVSITPDLDTPTTNFCAFISFEPTSGYFDLQLRAFDSTSQRCANSPFATQSTKLPSGTVQKMVITVDGEDTDDPSYYEDFFISPGECLLGDVYVPKGGNEKDYQIVGPLDCGFTFESIKLLLVDGADFEFKFLYSTSTQQCGVTVPCSADDLVTTNLLEPRVSCLQPCVDGTCFFELGYINRFFTDIKTDGVSSFTDMGYKYHPPYSTESGVVNIFYPDSCANLKAREKFWDSDENTILFDSTPADACDIEDEDEKCSLHNYVVSYNLAPDASLSNGPSWSDDAFSSTQSSEILKYWREEFGWDYSSSETIDGRVGYFGFRGQPISFAPGRHDTVSIIPVSEGDNYCWVLGGNFLDICTSDDCRESYDTLGCARTTGMHFVFSLFYVNLRLNQKSGFDNFKRITDQGENTFQLDNAYSLTNQYYVERVGTSDLDPLYHTVFALPSPCMVSGSQSLFYLESYEADCGVHIKPPCPGGWCAPIISRLSDPPLRTPLQVPGSGCSLVDCSEADGMTTVGTGEGGVPVCLFSYGWWVGYRRDLS